MSEIQTIVEYLKNPPFNRPESLVSFSQKSPTELLQVLNDVFGLLDSRMNKDIRDEDQNSMAARMLEFLSVVLAYKVEGDMGVFGENFLRGEQDVIYPILLWILERFEPLKKRAHIARYLKPFEIPEEYFADAAVVTMFQKYKEKQSEFKEIHKNVTSLRETAVDPSILQKEVDQLELERDQLKNKLSKLREKIKNNPNSENFDQMLFVTNKLRQEQEEEARLYQQLLEQQHRLARAEQNRKHVASKLQEMQNSDFARMDPHKLLQRLLHEVQQKRDYCESRLENDIMEKEKQLRHLSHVNSGIGVSEHEIDSLEQELHELRLIEENLTKRRDSNANNGNNEQLQFLRTRINAAEKKKQPLIDKLEELEEEKKEAEADLKKVNDDLKKLLGDSSKPKTDAQMKQYMNELSQKTTEYKKMKGTLDSLRSEISVLRNTENILRGNATNIEEFNKEQERKKGITGYAATQETLENISKEKAQLDQSKGETLEEISNIIERINSELKDRKNKLAPQIKELRVVRQNFENLETEYQTKRTQYNSIKMGYETERMKLERDVAGNVAGVAEEESSFFFLHTLSQALSARSEQVSREQKFNSSDKERLSGDHKNYTEMYNKMIAEQEALSKTLRQEKKNVTQKHDEHLAQRSLFQSLRTILQKKVEITKNGGTSNTMSYGNAGAASFGTNNTMGGINGPNPYAPAAFQSQQSHNAYLNELDAQADRLVLE